MGTPMKREGVSGAGWDREIPMSPGPMSMGPEIPKRAKTGFSKKIRSRSLARDARPEDFGISLTAIQIEFAGIEIAFSNRKQLVKFLRNSGTGIRLESLNPVPIRVSDAGYIWNERSRIAICGNSIALFERL